MATTENIIGTGVTGTGPHSFTFPYIKADDVKVTKTIANGTETTLTKVASSPGSTQYTQATTSITLGAALIDTDKLRIYRDTDTAGLVATFYPGSAIRSSDLNDNFTQNLYVTQESENDAATAITTADAADAIADDAADDVKRWIKDGDGTDTAGNEDDADFTQRPLKPQGVPYAITQAADAVTKSDTAKLATDNLVATNSGTTAAPVWVLQGDGLGGNPQGVKYAVTEAAAAVVTANAAAADVAAAVLYTTVVNKTALEAVNPSEDGYYEVTDSTGLANNDTWTDDVDSNITYTLSGITGSYPNTQLSGITTKLSYTHSSKTFAYSAYTVNDADDRYMVGPASSGNANEVLTTNGSGVFTWEVGGNVTIDGGTFTLGTSLVNSTVTYDGGSFN